MGIGGPDMSSNIKIQLNLFFHRTIRTFSQPVHTADIIRAAALLPLALATLSSHRAIGQQLLLHLTSTQLSD
jgi:hypothetical protein